MTEANMHYVCTRQEAREILARQDRFWLANCRCREERGCSRSRLELCLSFTPGVTSTPGGEREVSRQEVEAILREAEEKHLVMRPFRDEKTRTSTVGFCVCCDDCCGYFLHPDQYQCDKGAFVQQTDLSACTDCGDCAGVCYFGARHMVDGALALEADACYGCGLCLDVCPADCISLVRR
ncbi:MAG: 4Fe-4S binding protein [Anaerolineae bacterium]|nr:4Fe-4S binding protein [Anaerolineae bacterium]